MTGKTRTIVSFAVVGAVLALQSACGGGGAGGADSTAAAPVALLTPDSTALAAPAPDSFDVVFETSKGNFTVRARRAWAPIGVDRFHYLVQNGFFNDARFFRVVPNFVVQFGLSGNPQITAVWKNRNIMDDSVRMGNKRGRITYAMGGPNTRTTQVFINLVDNDGLDARGFPAFGDVIDGMSVVESLYSGYGDPPDEAMQQPNITARGNAYLAEAYPLLDYIKTATMMHH
jgi:peptidyl-prolyl cis-trans isomerase A (cyclophilin A)